MRFVRPLILLASLAGVVVVGWSNGHFAWWMTTEMHSQDSPIDPPVLVTRKPAPPPRKLYTGAIPASGAAELTISVHMS